MLPSGARQFVSEDFVYVKSAWFVQPNITYSIAVDFPGPHQHPFYLEKNKLAIKMSKS